MGKICLLELIRMPLLAILALVMPFISMAEEVDPPLVVPPLNVPVVNITSRLGSTSNAVHATLSPGDGYWCKAIISRYKSCTFWTSEMSPSTGVSGIEIYERNTLKNEVKKTERFVQSTDEDGSLRFIMKSVTWTIEDPSSLEFFVHISGAPQTKVTLSFQLAEVQEVLIGTEARPLRFDFFETKRAPVEWYDTVSRTIRDNGYYYMVSDLEAGNRYYFGVSTDIPDSTLFSVFSPNGDEVILSALDRYNPWDMYETNICDVITCLTNREERITVSQKYTVVSNENLSVTNVYTITGVYTNAIENASPAISNFVAVVTNIDMSVVGVQTTVEVVTNYEMCVLSIQTNIVQETNIAHVGICRDARRFVPKVSGEYLFVFKGSGDFSMYHAQMAAFPSGDDIEFSSPSGTFIPQGKALKLKILCLKELPSTNIYYTVDGSDPRLNGILYTSALKIDGPTVVRACLELDDGDKGEVVTAYYYPAKGNVGEVLGVEVFGGELSGSLSSWFEDVEKTSNGFRTIRSIPLEDGGSATFSLSIPYEGEFSFRWRSSSEESWDEAVFATNGIEVARISGETTWEDGLISILVCPNTELSWSYVKDDETSEGDDCVRLADFRFKPSKVSVSFGAEQLQIPLNWFEQYGIEDVGMAMAFSGAMTEEIVAKTNAMPRSLYESYVIGLNPTNEQECFEVSISVIDGKPVLTWSPDLGNDRVYTIWGSSDLSADSWHSPTNESDRFFKVKVKMP